MEKCPKCGGDLVRVSRTEIPGAVTRDIDRYQCRGCRRIVEKEVKWTEVERPAPDAGWNALQSIAGAGDVSIV